METHENQDAKELKLPLPVYGSIVVGSATSKDGEAFNIVAGLDAKLSAELVRHALDLNDEDLQRNTSDRKRFGEVGSYETWYAKDRTPFGLVHVATGKLAAVAWFGPKTLGRKPVKPLTEAEIKEDEARASENWHTISFRSYLPFRGKGLMKDFAKFTFKLYQTAHPTAKFWAGTNTENKASIALATSLGFTPDEKHSDRANKWLVMVKQ